MSQNRKSGADGDAFGRSIAPKIARALGATMTRRGSNEATLDGKRIVIKSGRVHTLSVGVSYQMLPNLHAVVGAFQRDDGAFDVFSLRADVYRQHMKNTRSRGPSANRVGIVTKNVFIAEGGWIGKVRIEESQIVET